MVNTYKLVNPNIHGKFKTKIEAKNSDEAANKFYSNLSEHFNNSVPEFYFTIQKGSGTGAKYSHYKVTEKRSNKDEVTYNLTNYKLKNEETAMKTYLKNLDNFIQSAGKSKKKSKKSSKKARKSKRRSDDSSDSSDSDSSDDSESEYSDFDDDTDILKLASKLSLNDAFHYWRYDPFLYGIKNLYIPNFYSKSYPFAFNIALAPYLIIDDKSS